MEFHFELIDENSKVETLPYSALVCTQAGSNESAKGLFWEEMDSLI